MLTVRVLSGRILTLLALVSPLACGRVGVDLGDLGGELDAGVDLDAQASPGDGAQLASRDSDHDGVLDSADGCPMDATKSAPGVCGCNVSPPAGLNAYWTFDETSGTAAHDLVGAKLGTLLNFSATPWILGHVGGALVFDGIDDSVALTGVITELRGISFWLKPSALGTVEVQTDWLSPDSFDSGGAWVQPGNAFVSDDQYTTGGLNNGAAEDFGGFGIALPAGTVISGIEAQVEMHSDNPTGTFAIELSWNAGLKQTNTKRDATPPPNKDQYLPFGGASDLWGRTWSSDELTDANFRVHLTKSGIDFSPMAPGVDHLRVRVHHAGVAVNPPLVSLGGSTRVELSATTVVATGFPTGTVVYVDGAPAGGLDTGWHHVVVVSPTDVAAPQVALGAAASDRTFFGGAIDDLKFFTVSPSAADVTTLRTNSSCR
ncbi:MAG: hypothetical protein JWN04_5365 [Myxococcaceae bacterium]|nr:hypothetical protein [Myxococcaceae bacterium]